MKTRQLVLTATFALIAFAANASETKSWCTAERQLPDGARSYESGWEKTLADAKAEALDSCESDVVVFPSSCEISSCTTRAVR